MESPQSAPPCLESGSFTESVETIRSSSVSHISQVRGGKGERKGRGKVGPRRGEGEGREREKFCSQYSRAAIASAENVHELNNIYVIGST